MTEAKEQVVVDDTRERQDKGGCGRCCLIVVGAILLLLMLLSIIALILALTVFKIKKPRTQILSATLDGVAPAVSFPAISIQLNVTLDLQLLVHNPNHASFRHGPGKSLLIYQGNQVGEADLYPGLTPATGTETLPCRLTLEVAKMTSNVSGLIGDVLGGELAVETHTRIPGRVNFLGILKKHVVATSKCQLTLAFPAMTVQKQECKTKTEL